MKTILIPIDLFDDGGWKDSLDHAVSLARLHGAKLHVLTVIPDFGMPVVGAYFPKDFAKNALTETKTKLAAFIAANIPDDVEAKAHVRHGTIYSEILAIANAEAIDMIVMASQRPEMKDYLLGPNAARVMRHAKQSVTVIR